MSKCSLHPNFLCKLLKYRVIFFKNTTERLQNEQTSAATLSSLVPTLSGMGSAMRLCRPAYGGSSRPGCRLLFVHLIEEPPGDVIRTPSPPKRDRRHHPEEKRTPPPPWCRWITTDTRHPSRRHRHPGDVIRTPPPPKRGRRPHPEEKRTPPPPRPGGGGCCC